MKNRNLITPSKNTNFNGKDTKNEGINQVGTDISLLELEQNFEQIEKEFETIEPVYGMFKIQSANKWMEDANKRPIPKMLFDSFWFEGEICILFADTNLGKSIVGVQIGDSISRGEYISGFKLEAQQQKVLYFDFELSDKQFENRYSINYQNHYQFHPNFERAEINTDIELPEHFTNFEAYLSYSLEEAIKRTGAKVLIIDNMTYLKTETEKAKNALPLMKELKSLKSKYNLSLLVLAHTPKRDLSKPITRNDLQGSKMLINFCDSCFSIGESTKDKGLRYLKQIKVRNTEHTYDTENVIVCQIDKPDNFLRFEFLDYGTEREHLKQISESDKKELDNQIVELKKDNSSLSNRQIARQLNTNHNRVKRAWERYLNDTGT
ncbi:MAG: AAA family ATPase [Chitinophagales bacterium]